MGAFPFGSETRKREQRARAPLLSALSTARTNARAMPVPYGRLSNSAREFTIAFRYSCGHFFERSRAAAAMLFLQASELISNWWPSGRLAASRARPDDLVRGARKFRARAPFLCNLGETSCRFWGPAKFCIARLVAPPTWIALVGQ